MAKRPRIPKYSLHKASGRARAILNGRHIWLGKYGSEGSLERYNRLVAELITSPAAQALRTTAPPGCAITITELCAAYLRHAEGWYVKDGKPTNQLPHVKQHLRILRDLYGSTTVDQFGPLALQAIQQHLVDCGISRVGINARIGGIKRIFKWGVAQELVPASVYQALACVGGLRKGRTKAPECPPVLPVDDGTVEATLLHLTAVVANMVRFQRYTGCRPGEVCSIRPCDVDRSGEVWTYKPESHKTQHGKERFIFIGPKAQSVLVPYLLRPAGSFCFSPADSEKQRLEELHAARVTQLSCGNKPFSNRVSHPKTRPGSRYTKDSYNRAIARAVRAENAKRKKAAEEAGVEPVLLPSWSPNRLRHAAATEVRRQFGLEAAQVTLGHAKADVTQVYAERDAELARTVALKIESVASLQRIVLDALDVLPYFSSPNRTKEGDHVGTGRISSGSYRGDYSC